DGWVRVGAEEFVNSDEAAIRQNANCNVLTIDRFTLRNELLQRYEVLICEEGLYGEDDERACDPQPYEYIDLYEPAVLDTDTEISRDTESFPNYRSSGVGRQLRAAEVNPLTRGCTTGDYNGNGVADLVEVQDDNPPVTFDDDREYVFWDMAYYLELHRGWYEERIGEDAGTWVIAERSRCDDESAAIPFPLGYYEGESSTYWRECARNRRGDFDADDPEVGYDFARYNCTDTDTGTCDDPPFLTDVVPDGSIPAHGQCEDWSLPPEDGVWRGMNHHSQFRCVSITDDGTPLSYEVDSSDIYTGSGSAPYVFNTCRIACPDGDASCATDCASGTCDESTEAPPTTPNGGFPVFECETGIPQTDDIGFVAQRYIDAEDGIVYGYEAGCIDEWEVWPDLCPGYSDAPGFGTVGDGLSTDFGSLRCGCSTNYGGADCEIGCPGAMVNSTYELAPRDGIWLCGGTSVTHIDATGSTYDSNNPATMVGQAGDSTIYELLGGVPDVPIVREQLCEEEDCATGFVLY
ncbi:MAG: hypothetical protein KC561_13195, partial [Myxococcales bacterium]|nr:hypothetical protein [Myxococcales bacterium]